MRTGLKTHYIGTLSKIVIYMEITRGSVDLMICRSFSQLGAPRFPQYTPFVSIGPCVQHTHAKTFGLFCFLFCICTTSIFAQRIQLSKKTQSLEAIVAVIACVWPPKRKTGACRWSLNFVANPASSPQFDMLTSAINVKLGRPPPVRLSRGWCRKRV